MIKSFRHKGLKELFETGRSKRVPADLRKRLQQRLDFINQARVLEDLNQPGWNLHRYVPSTRYAISVNGPWRILLEFRNGDAFDVDLEQYH